MVRKTPLNQNSRREIEYLLIPIIIKDKLFPDNSESETHKKSGIRKKETIDC
jgi:hypothetical protein